MCFYFFSPKQHHASRAMNASDEARLRRFAQVNELPAEQILSEYVRVQLPSPSIQHAVLYQQLQTEIQQRKVEDQRRERFKQHRKEHSHRRQQPRSTALSSGQKKVVPSPFALRFDRDCQPDVVACMRCKTRTAICRLSTHPSSAVPCNHLCLCVECARSFERDIEIKKALCPVCQLPIQRITMAGPLQRTIDMNI